MITHYSQAATVRNISEPERTTIGRPPVFKARHPVNLQIIEILIPTKYPKSGTKRNYREPKSYLACRNVTGRNINHRKNLEKRKKNGTNQNRIVELPY